MRKISMDKKVIVKSPTESRTRQEFKDQCDINKIINRHMMTGEITHINQRVPRYADTSKVPDYLNAMIIVKQAEMLFNSLPAVIRERFKNQPDRMVEFCQDDKNYDEAVKLGLIESPKSKNGEPGGEPEGDKEADKDKVTKEPEKEKIAH